MLQRLDQLGLKDDNLISLWDVPHELAKLIVDSVFVVRICTEGCQLEIYALMSVMCCLSDRRMEIIMSHWPDVIGW